MKVVFLLQARMGSSRLPGKVLMDFAFNESILDIIVNKIRDNFPSQRIIICTSTDFKDDKIASFAKSKEVEYYRGAEIDVLDRLSRAIETEKCNYAVRICCDNPFLNEDLLSNLIEEALGSDNADYIGYFLNDNLPAIKTHLGLFGEVIKIKSLHKANVTCDNNMHREHVTNHFYENSNKYKIVKIPIPSYLRRTDLRFTIDNEMDFTNMSKLYVTKTNKDYNLQQMITMELEDTDVYNDMQLNIKKYSK